MTTAKAKIKEAVDALAAGDDANWTGTGLPSVDAVSSALGERVTREDITAASDRTRPTEGDLAIGKVKPAEMVGNPAEPAPGGGMDRDPKSGGLVPSTAASQSRAASQASQYVPNNDGPEPDGLFRMLDEITAAASSPRYRRNQILQQIKLLWQNSQEDARAAQNKMEGRVERREEKRADREAAQAAA